MSNHEEKLRRLRNELNLEFDIRNYLSPDVVAAIDYNVCIKCDFILNEDGKCEVCGWDGTNADI